MFKRFIAILCCIAVLSFSCILSPATKASRMQIEAEASLGIVVGVSLAVVVCVVLLWYGISVTYDSTDAQSCVEFVKEKAKDAGIAASTLSLYAFMYMEQIGEWVADWIASMSEIYDVSSSSDFATISADKSSLDLSRWVDTTFDFTSSIGCRFKIDPYTNSSYLSDFNASGKYLVYCSDGIYLVFSNIPSNINIYLSSGGHFWRSRYTDLSAMDGFSFPGSYSTSYPGFRYSVFSSNPSTYNFYVSCFNEIGFPLRQYSGTLNDWLGNFSSVDYPSISADVNKEVVIPAAKDVFDGTGSLEDYQLDNPDVIDFGSALSQLQSSTGNPALTWEDVIGGVNTGEISVSDVLDATDTVPYVLTDSRTGELADADTPAEFVKPVALTDELAIPDAQTIADSEPYNPRHNKNDDTGKYRLPLFQFFPFCLPYDLYDFLSKLDVKARAPVWEIDTTPLFKHLRFFKADDGYKITIDLSKYDDIFSIIRVFECIGIVVGFVFVSRKLIHGGD